MSHCAFRPSIYICRENCITYFSAFSLLSLIYCLDHGAAKWKMLVQLCLFVNVRRELIDG